jgi:hypothetical protein
MLFFQIRHFKRFSDGPDGRYFKVEPGIEKTEYVVFDCPNSTTIEDDDSYEFQFSKNGESPIDVNGNFLFPNELDFSVGLDSWFRRENTQYFTFVNVPLWAYHEKDDEVTFFKLEEDDLSENEEEANDFFYYVKYRFVCNQNRTNRSNFFRSTSMLRFMIEYTAATNSFVFRPCSFQSL